MKLSKLWPGGSTRVVSPAPPRAPLHQNTPIQHGATNAPGAQPSTSSLILPHYGVTGGGWGMGGGVGPAGGSPRPPGWPAVGTHRMSGQPVSYPSGYSMTASVQTWDAPTPKEYPLTQEELGEVAAALAGWAKLREASAVGPFFVAEAVADNRGGRVAVQFIPMTATSMADAKMSRKALADALSSFPIGARVWVIVEG